MDLTTHGGGGEARTIKLIYISNQRYILSVYSPFSDRVGLTVQNIPSPFLSAMDIFFVDLKFGHIRFYTL